MYSENGVPLTNLCRLCKSTRLTKLLDTELSVLYPTAERSGEWYTTKLKGGRVLWKYRYQDTASWELYNRSNIYRTNMLLPFDTPGPGDCVSPFCKIQTTSPSHHLNSTLAFYSLLNPDTLLFEDPLLGHIHSCVSHNNTRYIYKSFSL